MVMSCLARTDIPSAQRINDLLIVVPLAFWYLPREQKLELAGSEIMGLGAFDW